MLSVEAILLEKSIPIDKTERVDLAESCKCEGGEIYGAILMGALSRRGGQGTCKGIKCINIGVSNSVRSNAPASDDVNLNIELCKDSDCSLPIILVIMLMVWSSVGPAPL